MDSREKETKVFGIALNLIPSQKYWGKGQALVSREFESSLPSSGAKGQLWKSLKQPWAVLGLKVGRGKSSFCLVTCFMLLSSQSIDIVVTFIMVQETG